MTGLLLVLLTAVGGILRFVALDRPTMWGDEAATWYRTVGSYRQLLDELDDTSFPPLHYQLVWWLGQGMPVWGEIRPVAGAGGPGASSLKEFIPSHPLAPGLRLTPEVMRALPAIAGTLMIPAMFFLARQMFGPRVALLAAALTCFNAYLMVYARDAKMYAPFYLLVTLHVGCLLWWIRTRTLTAWLCWVAAGVAMMGFHALGGFVLAIDVLIFLVAPRQNLYSLVRLLMFAGWMIAVPFVSIYDWFRRKRGGERRIGYVTFLRWPIGIWRRFALPPVLLFVPGLLIVAFCLRPYYTQFSNRTERVVQEDGSLDMRANGTSWVEPYNQGRTLGDLLLYTGSAYLTGWEWPREQGANNASMVAPRTLKLHKAATVGLMALLAIGLVPWRKLLAVAAARREIRRQDQSLPRPFVRRRLWWLAAWIVVPAYVMYTQSADRLATPADGVAALLLKAAPDVRWPRLPLLGAEGETRGYIGAEVLRPLAAQWAGAWREYVAGFTAGNLATGRCIALGTVLALVIVAAVWRRRWVGAGVLRVVLVVAVLMVLLTVLSALPRRANASTWMPRYLAFVLPAILVGAAALVARLPGWPTRLAFVALFATVNLWQFGGRVFGESEPPTRRIVADVIAGQPRSVLPSQPEVVTQRTYVAIPGVFVGPEPGRGLLGTTAAEYALWLESGLPVTPAQVLSRTFVRKFKIWRASWPEEIDRDLRRSPQIERFVIWTALPPGRIDLTDPIAERLAGRFKRVSDEKIAAHDHWMWTHLYTLRRREYVKLPNGENPSPVITPPAPTTMRSNRVPGTRGP